MSTQLQNFHQLPDRSKTVREQQRERRMTQQIHQINNMTEAQRSQQRERMHNYYHHRARNRRSGQLRTQREQLDRAWQRSSNGNISYTIERVSSGTLHVSSQLNEHPATNTSSTRRTHVRREARLLHAQLYVDITSPSRVINGDSNVMHSEGAEMNEIHKGRVPNNEKPFQGCMGRVINLLDYGPRMTTNCLLTDRAHSDGLVNKAVDSTRDRSHEKTIPNELRSNGTPMKMLIAHEMSKEAETKQKPANLVAKLMGLDALPEHQPNQMSQKCQTKGHLQSPLSRPGPRFLKHKGGFLDKQMQRGTHPFQDQQEYKDVYEVWQQSPKDSFVQHKSPEKGYSEKANERGMDLVREKFNEAKRLATDENLRQSKEFQDALEVLSSNKELFLKFLQEPNSLFSQQLYELQSLPSVAHTKRITVLRPSKSLGSNKFVGYEETNQKPMQDLSQSVEADIWEKNKSRSNSFSNQMNENTNHPTRIVVLKPSPRKTQEVAAVTYSPTLSSEHHHRKDSFGEFKNEEAQCSREVAKEITQQMHETLSSYPIDDTFLSSVFSNGYVGDESSFNRSDNGYVGEGNFSDSEIMTPISRVSWDYANKFGSPYSSSFSRASYSPESSVCREAKKRLSERWAMMASNGNGEEQRQIRRSSSTLGEMLALSETKKAPRPNLEGIHEASVSTSRSYGGEQEFRDSTSFLLGSENNEGVEFGSPKNLLRSRSVPVSSTRYGSRLNVEVPDPDIAKSEVPNGVEKSKSVKSSLKGKVSSLFFSRNKKRSKDKSAASSLVNLQDKSVTAETPKELEVNASVRMYDDSPQCITDCSLEEGPLPSTGAVLNSTASSPSTCMEQKQGRTFHEVLSMEKSMKARCSSENLNQPSPISVLEALFEDEDATSQSSGTVKIDLQGSHLQHRLPKSNLISKSPPIESLARSLSWDDATDLATPVHSKYSVFPSLIDEEQEWLLFIQKLLSSAGMSSGELSDATIAKWHSPECPLDPKLLEIFVDLNEDKFQWNETRCRQRRLNQKLIFDSVNEALVDIARYKSNASLWRKCSNATQAEATTSDSETLVTAEDVWKRMKEWFSGETKCFSGENEDSNSLVVERVVKKEVVGRGWVENMKLEVDGIGKKIEENVLMELVEEALFELAGRIR